MHILVCIYHACIYASIYDSSKALYIGYDHEPTICGALEWLCLPTERLSMIDHYLKFEPIESACLLYLTKRCTVSAC